MSLAASKLSNSGLSQAQNTAKQLRRKMLEAEHGPEIARKLMEEMEFAETATTDRKEGCCGCAKCKARLENPHAGYHLSAVINENKLK